MRLRTLVRVTAGTAVILFLWIALSAVTLQTPGWPLLGAIAALIVTPVAVLLLLRRTI